MTVTESVHGDVIHSSTFLSQQADNLRGIVEIVTNLTGVVHEVLSLLEYVVHEAHDDVAVRCGWCEV